MHNKSQQELLICNREGQVLAGTFTPSDLSIGENLLAHIPRRDARCLTEPHRGDLLLPLRRAGQYRAMLLTPTALDIPDLLLLYPLTAHPAALAALFRDGALPDFSLSPSLAALSPSAGPDACEAAYLELVRCRSDTQFFTSTTAEEDGFARCEAILRRLMALPPLGGCRISLTISSGPLSRPMHFNSALWSSMLFCLCRFLYRISADAAISLSLIGTSPAPTVILCTKLSPPLTPGACSLDWLAEHWPQAPELALCLALARRSGAVFEAFGTPDGALGISGQPLRRDPAVLGLKQENRLIDAAEEAAAREWCRLLPAVVPAEK